MPLQALLDMTWEEVDALDRDRTVAVVPIAAIEAHGPHLPIGTDGIIADAMARAGGERLAARGWNVLLMPRLDYTPASFAAAFPGTVPLNGESFEALLLDAVSALARHGIATVAIANAHFDPENISAIRRAVETIREEEIATVVFPDLTRKRWALRLTDEFRSGACHAGRYEGSIVLAERPDLVREEIRAELPNNPSSLSDAIRSGHTSFEAAGGARAYFGYPSQATAGEGRETIRTLGTILEEAVLEAATDRD